ncbi:uncharacterized protein LOC144581763 isoform X2 [Callithrix jacchus]
MALRNSDLTEETTCACIFQVKRSLKLKSLLSDGNTGICSVGQSKNHLRPSYMTKQHQFDLLIRPAYSIPLWNLIINCCQPKQRQFLDVFSSVSR